MYDLGELAVVELFVEGGMPVDAASFGGWTALHLAARNGHLSVVRYLLEQGASVLAETESGSSVRDVALQGGHTDLVEYIPRAPREELADRGIAYTVDAFLAAAEEGALAVVRLFVAAGMSVETADTVHGVTALHWAAYAGHLDVVEFLVGAGADVTATDQWGDTPRDDAVNEGNTDIVEYFDSLGVEEPRTSAAADARAELDRLGIAYTFAAFQESAFAGNLAVVRLFVQAGMSVDARDDYGGTALHWAAWSGHLSVVEFLVGAGADMDATNILG